MEEVLDDYRFRVQTEQERMARSIFDSDPRVEGMLHERHCLSAMIYRVETCVGVETQTTFDSYGGICSWCGRPRMPRGEEYERVIIAIGAELAKEK